MNAESASTAPPGAQRERTALAWRRTALAFALNSVLLLRTPYAWIEVAGLLTLACAAGLAAAAAFSFRDPETHGWFAGGSHRAGVLVLLAATIGVLDLIAVVH